MGRMAGKDWQKNDNQKHEGALFNTLFWLILFLFSCRAPSVDSKAGLQVDYIINRLK